MSTYRINFKQLRQRPDFLEMLAALERGFAAFHVDFYDCYEGNFSVFRLAI